MNSRTGSLLVVGAVCGFVACGGGDSTDEPEVVVGSSVVDSAGIRIVTNFSPAWADANGWRLAESPRLDLGALEGPAATQFFQVSDGAVFSDGGFVVSGFGSHDLRRFDATGGHLWTTGREGDGPGEFRGLMTIAPAPGDTLLTYDFRQRRISRWAPGGTLVDNRPLEGVDEGGFPFVETLLPDGRAVYTFLYFAVDDPPKPGELRRDPLEVRVATPGDSAALLLGEFPGREFVIMRESQTSDGVRVISGSPPFARITTTASDEGGVWVGDNDRPEILRYGLDGALQMIVRLPFESVDVTPDLVQRALAEELEDVDDQEEEDLARQRWEELPIPETLPYFEALELDRIGNLWVREFQAPGDPTRTWHVFAAEAGTWLGAVTFPDRVSPLEIGDDYVLARFGDELDVEHVQIWELIKP